jgi:hypothetical protein
MFEKARWGAIFLSLLFILTGSLDAAPVSIFIAGTGTGEVVTSDGAMKCSADCTKDGFTEGTTITFTATQHAASFAGWGGACAGATPTCTVTLSPSTRVVAYFRSVFVTIAVGAYHTCALEPNGHVVCWGRNSDGQTGHDGSNSPAQPKVIASITNAVQIAAGGYHTCVLLGNGGVQCWGNNDKGQVGDGTNTKRETPVIVSGLSEAVAVTAGGFHSCAVRAGGGQIFCWGYNSNGQLGDNSTTDRWTAVAVNLGAVGPVTKKIAAGGFHTCVIVITGSRVVCWGMNNDGQLGIGRTSLTEATPGPSVQIDDCITAINECAPIALAFLVAREIAASIGVGQLGFAVLGGFHSVALDFAGSDWGWGNNNEGQLPVPSLGLSKAFPGAAKGIFWADMPRVPLVKIAAGAYHTCVMARLGAGVYCFGLNDDGQAPGVVPTTKGAAVDVAAGGFHSCAVLGLKPPNTVTCWGNNGDGQVTGTAGPAVTSPTVVTIP